MNAHRLWWLGGAVAALAIAALAYLVGVSPQLSQAADAKSQEISAQGQLQQTEIQLAALKKQYESLPELTAKLATLQQSVPGAAKVSDFVRQIGDQASAAQVSVTTVNVSEPTAYAPAAAAPGVASPNATSAPTPSATPVPTATATTAPAPSTTAPPVAPPLATDPSITTANFVLLPVSLTVTGAHDGLFAFTSAVQNQGPRLFLVNKISLGAGAPGTTETGSAAATDAQTATLSGFIYVLVGNG